MLKALSSWDLVVTLGISCRSFFREGQLARYLVRTQRLWLSFSHYANLCRTCSAASPIVKKSFKMLSLRDTVALALASTFITVYVAGLPHPQREHHARAVDVAAFTPWELRPQKVDDNTKAKALDEKRAVNLEGFVPYMQYPYKDGGNEMHHEPGTPLGERDDYQTVIDETYNVSAASRPCSS